MRMRLEKVLVLFKIAYIMRTQSPPDSDRQNKVVGTSVETNRVKSPAVLHDIAADKTRNEPIKVRAETFVKIAPLHD